jgi:hypothetical protein
MFTNDDSRFQSEENEEDVSIGLIMQTSSDGNTLEVNLFRRVTRAITLDLRLQTFTHPRYQWIPQILRTPRCKRIDSSSVESIAWVFGTQHLDRRPNEGHQGMSNLFLLHYNDQGELMTTRDCYPFCSYYACHSLLVADCCYQERVWNGLQILRGEICRHLGRYSEKQGIFTKVSSQVVLGREAWLFLLSKVGSRVREPIGRNALISKRLVEPGLLLKSTQNTFYSTMIRFETEGELKCLSSVLGELVTMDIRKRRPRYKIVESLHVNDVINVVAGSEEREDPFRFRTNQQGIDLIFDGKSRVQIRMRYQRFQYNLPLAGPSTILNRAIQRRRPLGFGEIDSEDDSSDDGGPPDSGVARVGREFEHMNRLYRLQSIDSLGQTVKAKVVWPIYMNEQVDSFELLDVEGWIFHRQQEQLVY